jgi:hypothetical protein
MHPAWASNTRKGGLHANEKLGGRSVSGNCVNRQSEFCNWVAGCNMSHGREHSETACSAPVAHCSAVCAILSLQTLQTLASATCPGVPISNAAEAGGRRYPPVPGYEAPGPLFSYRHRSNPPRLALMAFGLVRTDYGFSCPRTEPGRFCRIYKPTRQQKKIWCSTRL